jgi:CDP-glucose 4,6-dehydratase
MEIMEMTALNLFDGVYRDKKVFITGDTGFKGSWLSLWLHELGAKVFGYALPPKTDRDNYVRTNLGEIISHTNGDVRDFGLLKEQLEKVKPDFVFHLAAQPLVLESYSNPHYTFETNIMGTINVLEAIRTIPEIKVFVNITSDKCYQNTEIDLGYKESDPMGGKDPYSASKGCSELVTASYFNSFFNSSGKCKIGSARAGNVIGGGDWAINRIVPDFFRSVENNRKIFLRNPDSIRPWQHVLEPLSGYLALGAGLFQDKTNTGEGWNFGPMENNDFTVRMLIERFISLSKLGIIAGENNSEKPYEAKLLKLDISKAQNVLNWKPTLRLDETIKFTVDGYLAELATNNVYENRINQIKKYISLAKEGKQTWASSN